jgi:hypothetical protein
MEPLEIILVAGLIYLAYQSGALAPFGIAPGVSLTPTSSAGGLQPNVSVSSSNMGAAPAAPGQMQIPSRVPFNAGSTPQIAASGPVGSVTGVNKLSYVTAASSVGIAAATPPANLVALGLTGAAAGAAVAGIGAVVAIAAALWAAHEARVKQAKDENSAMNLGVQGVDKELAVINQAFNSHQISAADAVKLLSATMSHYWALVTPHIQPGRNGCSGGAACPPWHTNGCSGSIGAACCVGCYDLAGGPEPAVLNTFDGGDGVTPFYFGVEGALIVCQHGGNMQSCMQGVVASKYGGQNRNGYRLTWQQVGT